MKNKRTEQGTIGMKFSYAGRFNSFVFKNATVYDAIDSYRKMNGITSGIQLSGTHRWV